MQLLHLQKLPGQGIALPLLEALRGSILWEAPLWRMVPLPPFLPPLPTLAVVRPLVLLSLPLNLQQLHQKASAYLLQDQGASGLLLLEEATKHPQPEVGTVHL